MIDNDIEAIKKRTEENRKAIPQSVLASLSERNVLLDDVIKMTRQEFASLFSFLQDEDLTEKELRVFIDFKHQSMTHDESLVFFDD